MNNEQNKPVELTEKELAGIAGGLEKRTGMLVEVGDLKNRIEDTVSAVINASDNPVAIADMNSGIRIG